MARYRFAERYVKGKRVVDAACGVGYGSALLKASGAASVIGLDVCEETLAYAHRVYAGEEVLFRAEDLNSYDFTQAAPEIIVSFETIEHLVDPRSFLDRARVSLPQEGLLIASVPTAPMMDIDRFHLHDFSVSSWKELVGSSGFSIIDSLSQRYCASLKDLIQDSTAGNVPKGGACRNLFKYYLKNPNKLADRLYRLLRFGLEFEVQTFVCRPRA